MDYKRRSARPTAVAFIDDLMLATRIENAAGKVGFDIVFWGEPSLFGEEDQPYDDSGPGEPVQGRAGLLMDRITSLQPALVIFDLSYRPIPWKQWVPALKSSPATRRLPIICFGPHVDEENLQKAADLGADAVFPRSKFLANTAEVILRQANLQNSTQLRVDCEDQLSDTARAGLEAFNRGEYYESHELLEDAWNEDDGPGGELYRAILQIAVAYLQIERGNYRGAIKMFLRSRQWLQPMPDICRGVDVSGLNEDADLVYNLLLELGPKGIDGFDRTLFRPISFP